jgi:hypothetical protein
LPWRARRETGISSVAKGEEGEETSFRLSRQGGSQVSIMVQIAVNKPPSHLPLTAWCHHLGKEMTTCTPTSSRLELPFCAKISVFHKNMETDCC